MMKTLFSVAVMALFFASTALGAEPVVVRPSGKMEIRDLEAGKPFLTNRPYLLKRIPPELSAMKFTAGPGGANNDFHATIPKGVPVYLALDDGKNSPAAATLREYARSLEQDGWKTFGKIPVSATRMDNLRVFVKTFKEAEFVAFKGYGFVGSIIIAPEIELKGR